MKYWWAHFLPLIQDSGLVGSLLELALWVKTNGKACEVETLFVIASSIWGRRNKRIFEGLMEGPKAIIERNLENFKLYLECLSTLTQDLVKVGYWKPPDSSCLKLNMDGAILVDLQDAGISSILRNSERDVLMAASFKERSIQHLETIKSLAILKGI